MLRSFTTFPKLGFQITATTTATSSFTSLRNCASSSKEDSNSKFLKVVGTNTQLPIRTSSESKTNFNDIIGGSHSTKHRIAAGDLLAAIDVAAAQTAARHVFGKNMFRQISDVEHSGVPTTISTSTTEQQQERKPSSVTTVAFSQIVLPTPIMNGDFVNLEGKIVDAGNSSLSVHVNVSKLEFPTVPGERKHTHVADAFASFVAIGNDLRPVKCVPRIGLVDERSVQMYERCRELARQNKIRLTEESSINKMSINECRDVVEKCKQEMVEVDLKRKNLLMSSKNNSNSCCYSSSTMNHDYSSSSNQSIAVSMKSSTIEANHYFMKGQNNLHNTIFGGRILEWMENIALLTGRRFCCNQSVFSLAMHSMNFHSPIFHTDAVSARARVVNVRNSTLEIDVEVFVDRADGSHATSNCASFVLVSLTNYGKAKPLGIELDMNDATEDEMRAHTCAIKRYSRLASERID